MRVVVERALVIEIRIDSRNAEVESKRKLRKVPTVRAN